MSLEHNFTMEILPCRISCTYYKKLKALARPLPPSPSLSLPPPCPHFSRQPTSSLPSCPALLLPEAPSLPEPSSSPPWSPPLVSPCLSVSPSLRLRRSLALLILVSYNDSVSSHSHLSLSHPCSYSRVSTRTRSIPNTSWRLGHRAGAPRAPHKPACV
jgi:hypothetical protein